MKCLGVLLIITGIVFMVSVSFLIGLILIVLGVICISSANKREEEEEQEAKDRAERINAEAVQRKEAQEKEVWIAKRTQELINSGLLPSDAKIQAETEYVLSKNG